MANNVCNVCTTTWVDIIMGQPKNWIPRVAILITGLSSAAHFTNRKRSLCEVLHAGKSDDFNAWLQNNVSGKNYGAAKELEPTSCYFNHSLVIDSTLYTRKWIQEVMSISSDHTTEYQIISMHGCTTTGLETIMGQPNNWIPRVALFTALSSAAHFTLINEFKRLCRYHPIT